MASRLRQLMSRTVRYSIDGGVRLADDAGVSRSLVARLLTGECSPSYRAVAGVLAALEADLGVRIDGRDMLSFTGDFPTTVCELVRCRGCPRCRRHKNMSALPARREGSEPLPLEKRT